MFKSALNPWLSGMICKYTNLLQIVWWKNEFIIINKENDNRSTLMNTTNLFFCIMDIQIWHLVSCGRTYWLEEVPTESQAFWLVDTTLCLFLSHSPAVILKHFSCELLWSGFHFLAFCTLLLLLPDFHGCLANLVETKERIPFCYPCNSDPVCIHTEFLQRKTSKHEFQGQWRYCVSSILLYCKSAENQIAGLWRRQFSGLSRTGLVTFLLQPACIECNFYFERKPFLVSLPLCECLQTSWCLQFKLWVTTAICLQAIKRRTLFDSC